MYHRNKVHTDEFWRYELTKNRRSFVDDRVNEDLWKKQLGKHGEETETKPVKQETTVSPAATPALNASEAKEEQMKWLEQINRSSSSQMSPEMKLFALQSLQKSLQSLQYISGNNTTGVVAQNKVEAGSIRPESAPSPAGSHQQLPNLPKELPGGLKQELTDAPTNDSSYLALLAQISRRESATMQEGGDDPMPPTSSESAANRTQMWLAQVTKYRNSRSSSGLKEESHTHDTLWEQQIARIKNNPVRSPLEPVEITLDDDTTVVVVSKTNSTILSTSNINNNNNNNTDSLPVYQSLPVPHAPKEPLPGSAASLRHSHDMLAEKEEDAAKEGRSNEDQSMLKSLLLDRFKRKRSSASSSDSSGLAKRPGKSPPPLSSQPSTAETAPASPPASQPAIGFEPPQEILRKRLLGWVDQPATPPPAATATAYQGSQPQQQQPTQQPSAVDLRATEPPHQHQRQQQQEGSTVKEEESRKEEQQVSYTQTSVLKHLLYRYTAGVRK